MKRFATFVLIGTAALALIASVAVATWLIVEVRAASQSVFTTSQLSTVLGHPMVELRSGPQGETEFSCECWLPVAADEIPQNLKNAIVAAEDRRFFVHSGIDWVGLARAIVVDFVNRHLAEGGSTLTQQLAKTIVGSDRTPGRKIWEAVLAKRIEATVSKDEILNLYLNRVFFGRALWGVEMAARTYFHKAAKDLNLLESAILAGMVNAPNKLDPERHPKAALVRAKLVLNRMIEEGSITRAVADKAMKVGVRPGTTDARSVAAFYYMAWVARTLALNSITPGNGTLRVVVALNPWIQSAAEDSVAQLLTQGAAQNAGEAALISMLADGSVLALVGGSDYRASQFDRATQALRQPGSAYKPFVYLAAIEKGYKPTDTLIDKPLDLGGWRPQDSDHKFRGVVTLLEALTNSLNVPTIRLAMAVGLDRVVATGLRFGVSGQPTPAAALGTTEVTLAALTSGYATIAAGGRRARPSGVVSVLDGRGAVLLWNGTPSGEQVAEPKSTATLIKMLQNVVTHGTARAAEIKGHVVAGKTGTTQDYRDAWFVGFTSSLVTGVWVGNDDNSPMHAVAGGSLPAAAWRNFTTIALRHVADGAMR